LLRPYRAGDEAIHVPDQFAGEHHALPPDELAMNVVDVPRRLDVANKPEPSLKSPDFWGELFHGAAPQQHECIHLG
jgi:hypothetical protein